MIIEFLTDFFFRFLCFIMILRLIDNFVPTTGNRFEILQLYDCKSHYFLVIIFMMTRFVPKVDRQFTQISRLVARVLLKLENNRWFFTLRILKKC